MLRSLNIISSITLSPISFVADEDVGATGAADIVNVSHVDIADVLVGTDQVYCQLYISGAEEGVSSTHFFSYSYFTSAISTISVFMPHFLNLYTSKSL